MASDAFAQVFLGAALAEGAQKLSDSMRCFEMEISEWAAEHGVTLDEEI